MTPATLSTADRPSLSAARADIVKAAFIALLLGLGLVYVAGFSTSNAAHNAAHDARHAQAFPCH